MLRKSGLVVVYRAVMIIAALGLVSCGRSGEPVFKSNSANGGAEITVWRVPHFPDFSVRISVRDDAGVEEEVYRDRVDRYPVYAEFAWSDDNARVAVLVCDNYADDLLLSVDVRTKSVGPADDLIPRIEQSLQRQFGAEYKRYATRGEHITRWLCDEAAMSELRINLKRKL